MRRRLEMPEKKAEELASVKCLREPPNTLFGGFLAGQDGQSVGPLEST